jgi:hypothetical protein
LHVDVAVRFQEIVNFLDFSAPDALASISLLTYSDNPTLSKQPQTKTTFPKSIITMSSAQTSSRNKRISTRSCSFPRKLYGMLEDAAKQGFEDIVSWQPGNNSFKVLKPKLFAATIMQRHFKQTQYKSFQRQLNIYGFQRIHYGPNMGGYMHSCFIKGHPELCPSVTRQTGPRVDSQTPTIYTLPLLMPNLPLSNEALRIDGCELKPLLGAKHVKVDDIQIQPLYRDNRLEMTESEENLLLDIFGRNDTAGLRTDSQTPTIYTVPHLVPNLPSDNEALKIDGCKLKPLLGVEDVKVFDVQIQPLHRDSRFTMTESEENLLADIFGQNDTEVKLLGREFVIEEVNDIGKEIFQNVTSLQNGHTESSTGDISSLIGEHTTMDDIFSLNCGNYEEQKNHSEHAFPFKLHRMLDDADRNGFAHIVSWVEEGAAFKVHDSEAFLAKVMPNYFDQSKYECFRRQLNVYDFNRVSKGPKRGGTYYHRFFLRSDRGLCQNINRPTSTITSTIETRVRSRHVRTVTPLY